MKPGLPHRSRTITARPRRRATLPRSTHDTIPSAACWCALCLSCLAACSTDDGTPSETTRDDTGSAGVDAAEAPDSGTSLPDMTEAADAAGADLPPGFLISVVETRGASAGETQLGFVSVANPPASELPQITRREVDGCRFVEPEWPGYCEPPCPWPAHCGADDVCHEGVPQRFAGDISLTGLLVECSLPVTTSGGYRYYAQSCVPADPADLFAPGAVLTAAAAGGNDLPAFTLTTRGVASLATTLPCDGFSLQAGTSLEVRWEPSHQAGDRMRFFLVSANHGSQFGHIECEMPDTGVLRVDSSLVDLHLQAFNPMPSWRLTRVHTSGAVVDGLGVDLEARSEVVCMYGR